MSNLKKFFYQFSHFFTGNVINFLFGFITFPILTRVLPKEDYGILGLVTITISIVVTFSKAGLSDGIIRYYSEYRESASSRSTFSSTVFFRGILLSVVSVLIYIFLLFNFFKKLNLNSIYLSTFLVMSIYLFIRPLNIIVLNLLRVEGKSIFINILTIIEKGISIALSLILLLYFFHQIFGYFLGVIIAELLISFILFSWLFRNYHISIGKASTKIALTLIKFGMPMLLTELSYLLLSYADRYMIVYYYDENMLGLYTVGYNLAMYVSGIITFSISYAIIPIYVDIYSKSGREETELFLHKCTYYLLIFILPICFGYYAISNDLFIFLASEKYVQASKFSPIILIANVLLGLNNIFYAGLYLKKKAFIIFFIMFFSTIINIILNIFLIPSFGVMGATISTLIAAFCSSIFTIFFSFHYITIRFDYKQILFYVILCIIMVLFITQINYTNHLINLIVRILLGCFFISSGFFLYERDLSKKLIKAIIK